MPVITFGNFKGGVSKTTTSVMTAYEIATYYGKKTLLIDTDPQANATQILQRTYLRQKEKPLEIEKSLMAGISDGDLDETIVNIDDNLDLIPGGQDLQGFDEFLYMKFPRREKDDPQAIIEQRLNYIKSLIAAVKDQYDYVIIDTPPALDMRVTAALYSSDEVCIVLQLEQPALDGAESYFYHLQEMINTYDDIDFDLLGVVPVMMTRDSSDKSVLRAARQKFGAGTVFSTVIPHMARIKLYARQGIANIIKPEQKHDHNDVRPHLIYRLLAAEVLERNGEDISDRKPRIIDPKVRQK